MTFANSSTAKNSTARPVLAQGWVNQPDVRGTINIMWTCVLTIFICSWSVLSMNVPPAGKGRWGTLMIKLRWVLFTIFAPEIVSALAAEQWVSASQSVDDFTSLDPKTSWTIRHAFFADMGGIMLDAPDFPPFPVDAHQMHYLVANNYIVFPVVDQKDIWDKNKSDEFTRVLTVWQTGWFGLQCIGRAVQHLALSSFELSTVAFVSCTIPTFFFWYHKPVGVSTPIVVKMDTRIASILTEAGECASEPYSFTPLSFINSAPCRSRYRLTSGLEPFWLSLYRIFKLGRYPEVRPISSFGNSKRIAPRGVGLGQATVGAAIGTCYTGLHLVGWNFAFPTYIEQIFWRVASSILVFLLVDYLIFLAIGSIIADKVAQKFFQKRATSATEMIRLLPDVLQTALYFGALAAYGTARLYIIVEAFISLRALPVTAYSVVSHFSGPQATDAVFEITYEVRGFIIHVGTMVLYALVFGLVLLVLKDLLPPRSWANVACNSTFLST